MKTTTKPFHLILTEVGEDAYDISVPPRHLDAHLSKTDDGWVIDIFNSRVRNHDKAHITSFNATLLPSGEPDWAEILSTLREIPNP